MERTIFLSVVFLIVLNAFTKGAPVEEENDSDVMRRNSLLENLGMELHRDPYYSPYKRRCYCGPRRPSPRYRKRKGNKGSSGSSSSGSESESGGSPAGNNWGFGKYAGRYGKYGYKPRYRGQPRRKNRGSSDEE